MSAKKTSNLAEQEKLQQEQSLQDFENWIGALREYHMADWEALPEIDLYMDQVVTFLEQSL